MRKTEKLKNDVFSIDRNDLAIVVCNFAMNKVFCSEKELLLSFRGLVLKIHNKNFEVNDFVHFYLSFDWPTNFLRRVFVGVENEFEVVLPNTPVENPTVVIVWVSVIELRFQSHFTHSFTMKENFNFFHSFTFN